MVKVDSWEQAKLLFEMGKGLREISRQLDLPVSSLSRKSKDWKQLPIDMQNKAKANELHQEFNQYINVDIEKLKTIRDIFAYQSEQRKVQVVKVKAKAEKVREKAALDTIEQLLGVKLIREFQVGGFRIDGYDADNKVAYEIDEEQHRGTKHSQHDVLRQKFIEEQLCCTFKRIKV